MISNIKIEGFKSIKKMELELRAINIFIGSNGSGKSNFISFFKLIQAIFNGRLQKFAIEEKADNLLYFGRKNTEVLFGELKFDSKNGNTNSYYCDLAPTPDGGMYIASESSGYNNSFFKPLNNLQESHIPQSTSHRDVYLRKHLINVQIFHFHDTSTTSYLRRSCAVNDNGYLKQDGRNLPAFLYLIKTNHPKVFERIVKTIQSVAPYIDQFILEPNRLVGRDEEIELRWVDKGDTESNFSAYQLSDGTLRFIALTTLLLQPTPPSVIIIDEPELGLHPFAIGKLAGMIKTASAVSQIIAATQSPGLISNFEPEDIVVIDKSESENQSVFNRLNAENLNAWLQEYTLGDLWERNMINGGQPFVKQ